MVLSKVPGVYVDVTIIYSFSHKNRDIGIKLVFPLVSFREEEDVLS